MKKYLTIFFAFFFFSFFIYCFSIQTKAKADDIPRLINLNNGLDSLTDIAFINNKDYFIVNPKHAHNNLELNPLGTCATIGIQMLLGYNNYYVDRRIIPEYNFQHERFLSSNYGDSADNPLINLNVGISYGKESLGSLDSFYNTLLDYDVNEYLSDPLFDQPFCLAASNLEDYFGDYCEEISDDISVNSHYGNINGTIINEISNNRPVLVVNNPIAYPDKQFHVFLAYGYAKYNGIDGYIVSDCTTNYSTFLWANADNFFGALTINVSHQHIFQSTISIYNVGYCIKTCSECGCTIMDKLYEVSASGHEITRLKYNINGPLTIPTQLYGENITSIGSDAFSFYSGLSSVTIPSTINSIGSFAFEDCNNLKTIIVDKPFGDVISLGSHVFSGTTVLNTIVVPQNKLFKYVKASGWSSFFNIITSTNNNYNNINLNCYYPLQLLNYLDEGDDLIYQINVDCSKSYVISSTANYPIHMYIHSSDHRLIASYPTISNNGMTNSITIYLSSNNTYYLDISFDSLLDEGAINTTITQTYPIDAYEVFLGDNNIINHFHNVVNTFESKLKFMSFGSGFYKFEIFGIIDENAVFLDQNSIAIYNKINNSFIQKNKFNMIDNQAIATNIDDSNGFIVYLNSLETIYINFVNEACFSYLHLKISMIDEISINLFSISENQTCEILNMDYENISDNFCKINLLQPATLDVRTNGLSNGLLIVYEEVIINNEIAIEYELVDSINAFKRLSLNKGVYYFGYINCEVTLNPNNYLFSIRRVLTDYGSNNLLIDPTNVLQVGTEITLNGGSYNSNIITQGFTRLIYLYNEDSRLDYYWYSSDESIAIVTNYGTVLGMDVLNDSYVRIMAINKYDFSICYVKELVVQSDDKTFQTNPIEFYGMMVIERGIENGTQIDLSNINVPINILQYYEWSVDTTYVNVNIFGFVYADLNSPIDGYIITGDYILNTRVKVHIYLDVVKD